MNLFISILILNFFRCFNPSIPVDGRIFTTEIITISYDITKTIGFVTYSDKARSWEIKIYNKDGSVWKVVSFDEKAKSPSPKVFSPYAFHKDYFLFAARCIRKDSNYYQVIINEDSNTIKYLKVDDVNLKFQTWEDHILSCFSVGFQIDKNPIRFGPSVKTPSILFDKDELYQPNKIQGEWLQLKWGNQEHWNYGWIKWKEQNKLLIELFYFC